jgi:hypothetical protein
MTCVVSSQTRQLGTFLYPRRELFPYQLKQIGILFSPLFYTHKVNNLRTKRKKEREEETKSSFNGTREIYTYIFTVYINPLGRKEKRLSSSFLFPTQKTRVHLAGN